MKRFKRIAVLGITLLCITLTLTACQKKGFESVRTFEFHFFKEEYEEKYNRAEKTMELKPEANYKINITSSVDSGTIAMKLSYLNYDGKAIIVNMTAPGTESIEIASGTTSAFTFTAQIDSDTQGVVKVEIFSDKAL